MWNKLRNVIVGAALFKKAGKKSARRRLSSNVDFLTADKSDGMEHALSRSSLDSSHSQDTEAAHSDCESSFACAISLPSRTILESNICFSSDSHKRQLCV